MNSYRESLRVAVSASAAPYGYTITVWSSGAVAIRALGFPEFGQVLLFIAGAVVGFTIVQLTAFGMLRVGYVPAGHELRLFWAGANLLPAASAVGLVWCATEVLPATAAWALSGLFTTSVYLLLHAGQVTLASRS